MRTNIFLLPAILAVILCAQPRFSEAADLSACGSIDVKATAACKIEVDSGGCKTDCTSLHFETVCRPKVYTSCKNDCKITLPSVDCTTSCNVDCNAACKVNPGSFECSANCNTKCMGDCKAYCAKSGSSTNCEGSCKTTCSTECSASCTGQAPSMGCEANCTAGCKGSCSITEPYISCQVKCQDVQYNECSTTLKGKCETECTQPDGALFCDGQYVDNGGKLRECIDALKALKISVDYSASGSLSSDCKTGSCTIAAKIAAGCGFAPAQVLGAVWLPGALLGLLGIVVLIRSRLRRK